MAKKSIDYAAARRAAEEKARKKRKKNIIIAIVCVAAIAVAVVAGIVVSSIIRNIKDNERRKADFPKIENVAVENAQNVVDLLEDRDFVEADEETDYIIIDVKNYGKIVCELREDIAPITVKNFKKLVSEKFYDGLIFHRVIEDFMIQGGGYTEAGKEKDAAAIKGEFASNGVKNDLKHYRGVLSMARTSVKDSASSQFFIMHKTSPHLDSEYASFGYVLAGMEVVDKIAAVRTNSSDAPINDVVIESVRFAKLVDLK